MDFLKLIVDKEREFDPLYQRMDTDRKAVYLNKYTLSYPDSFPNEFKNKPIPNTVSSTMNDAGVFANAVVSVMQSSKRQTTIEGLKDRANKTLEQFIDDSLYAIDQKLKNRRIPSLWSRLCAHVAVRGPIAGRLTCAKDGSPECLPCDFRYLPFEDGPDGLIWVARHTIRSGKAVLAEYPNATGIDENAKKLHVYDAWDDKVNEVYVNGNKIFDQANTYGYPPFIIEWPDVGYGLEDDDALEHQAESIFFLVRNLFDDWNRLQSIQNTKALETVRPPFTHEVTDTNIAESESQPYPHKMATNTPVLEGETPHLLETKDVNLAFTSAQQQMAMAIHKGSPSISDLSETAGERNAQWITEQTEIRNKIMFPRLQALESWCQQFADMRVKQYRQFLESGGEAKPFGKREAMRVYALTDVPAPDQYTVNFRYMPDNPRMKLVNYSQGIALWGKLPRKTIIKEIFQVDDPQTVFAELDAEEAAQANPVVFYLSKANGLLDLAETKTGDEKKMLLRQAKVMADAMVQEIRKNKMSAIPAQGTKQMQLPQGNSQALMALPSTMGGA